MLTIIRSSLLLLGMIVATILYSLPCVIARLLPYRLCFRFISSWCAFNTFWARLVCGVRYEIQGLEKIPEQSCVIMSNHQSTWETLAFPGIFPTLTWVIKKRITSATLFWLVAFYWQPRRAYRYYQSRMMLDAYGQARDF